MEGEQGMKDETDEFLPEHPTFSSPLSNSIDKLGERTLLSDEERGGGGE